MKKNSVSADTQCVIAPETPLDGFASLATPVYRASTIVFPDAASYRTRAERGADGYTYGLAGTPTSRTLEAQVAATHAAERSIIVPSGQAAISAIMLTVLKSGDHVLITDNVYPPVKQFAREILAGLGIQVEYFDPTDLAELKAALRPGETKLVWLESPGSSTMELTDLKAASTICGEAGALVGCDNTWATGLLCRPLDLGVDVVAEALTKYVGGHSDILLGAVVFKDLSLYARVRRTLGSLGVGVSPDECSLALRGMQTMALRLRHVGAVSEELARRIEQLTGHEVLHPSLPSFGGHALWQRDFSGSSGVFSVRLDGVAPDRIDRGLDSLKTFAIGASWGGTRSLIVPMVVTGDRSVRHMGENATFVRISIGLEGIDDLWADLQSFFEALRN